MEHFFPISWQVATFQACVLLNIHIAYSPQLFAQEFESQPIVVKASTPSGIQEELNETVHVDDPALRNYKTVGEVLSSVPGVQVVSQGGTGKTTSVFLRGANSEHVLVLIDGVEVNDVMSPTKSFDFSRLSLDGIEKIEVIKGPSTVRFGSDAIGGVINIITKPGEGPMKAFVEVEAGSYHSVRSMAGVSARSERRNYNITFSRHVTQGFSSANARDGNSEADGHEQTQVTSRVGTRVGLARITATGQYTDAKTDLDISGGAGGDDPNFVESTEQSLLKIQGDWFWWNKKISSLAAINFSQIRRTSRNQADLLSSTTLDEAFRGKQIKLELVSSYDWTEHMLLSLGLQGEEEQGEGTGFSSRKSENFGVFLHQEGEWGGVFESTGVRLDRYSMLDTEVLTFHISPGYSYNPTGTTVGANFGKAFKAPSLFQVFDSVYGNRDLRPEQVLGFELQARQTLAEERAEMQISYFENDFQNLITLDPSTFRSVNVGSAKIRGLESSLSLRLTNQLSVHLKQLHLLQSESEKTHERLVRRPRNSWSILLQSEFANNLTAVARYRQIGQRDDFDATTFQRVSMSSYEILDGSLEYTWPGAGRVFLRIENAFDRSYEEINGYGTAGFSFYAGVRLFSFSGDSYF